MNTIETRLAAALAARAELVEPEDLTPAEPPAVVHRPRFPRPAVYGLVAAAACAAVAAPFVIGGLGGDDDASPTPAKPVEGAAWPLQYEESADIDGDGADDRVEIRIEPGETHRARLAVVTDAGEAALLLANPGDDIEPRWFFRGDSLGGQEIALAYTDAQGSTLAVVTLRDGALLPVTVPDPDLRPRRTEDGKVHLTWVGRDGLLHSGTSLGVVAADDVELGSYRLEATRWSVTEEGEPELVGSPAGELCVASDDDGKRIPTECLDGSNAGTDGFDAGASPFLDRTDDRIYPGEGFDLVINSPATISLVPRDASTGDGPVRLQVQWEDGAETSVELENPVDDPDGVMPTLHTTLLDADRPMLVVRWGGSTSVTQIYAVIDGELVLVPFTSYYGNNQSGDPAVGVHSVLTEDGSFYALASTLPGDTQVYRWDVEYEPADTPAYLVLGNEGRSLGTWCTDDPESDAPYLPC